MEAARRLPLHERYKAWLGYFMVVLALEVNVRFLAFGSTTFKRKEMQEGLEPDRCYYFKNISRIRDWKNLDLDRGDPPPDLAVDVASHYSMETYAQVGVPEVWCFDGEHFQAYRLGKKGPYQKSSKSGVLPFVPLEEIGPLMLRTLELNDDREILLALQKWVRKLVKSVFQTARKKP